MLASGSKGNAIFVSDGITSILFDAGLSGKEMERRLTSRKLSPASIKAIVVSHEHSDHIQGVGVLARRYKIPVYINHQTYQAAKNSIRKAAGVGTGISFHWPRAEVCWTLIRCHKISC